MAKRRCRLCKKPVIEGSMFCEHHHSQALLFSASFGKQETEEVEQPPEEQPAEEERPRTAHERRTRRVEGEELEDLKKLVNKSRQEDGSDELDPIGGEDSTEPLYAKLHEVFDKILSRVQGSGLRGVGRWPQISFYFLHDELRARAYYSIIPNHDKEEEEENDAFPITSRELASSLRPNGTVFQGFAEQFGAAAEALRQRKVQTIDLHFLTYAGLVAINEHLPTQKERNLVTYELQHGQFKKVDATEVATRLHHDRW